MKQAWFITCKGELEHREIDLESSRSCVAPGFLEFKYLVEIKSCRERDTPPGIELGGQIVQGDSDTPPHIELMLSK